MSFDASQPSAGASVGTAQQAAAAAAGASTLVHGGAGTSVDNTDPLNPVITNTGVRSLNGATGDVLINAVPTQDSVNTTGNKLSALASANYTAGAMVYVVSVADFFKLQQSALTVDHINVETASGKAGYQWVRMLLPNPGNASVATWSVDTTSGSDESDGLTDNTAVKTVQEIKRRLWGLSLPVNTTVTLRILSPCTSTDTGAWMTAIPGSSLILFQGFLGSLTGAGGATHDNTLYTGTVTTFTAPAAVPTADDTELADTTIPVSFTASGLLAEGVIFKRTNSTNLNWFACKDLGSKTLRITGPQNNAAISNLAVNDTYGAYQLSKIYTQNFGPYAINARFDTLDDEGVGAQTMGEGVQRRRCWIGGASRTLMASIFVNCLWSSTGNPFMYSPSPFVTMPAWSGGGLRGAGTTVFTCTTGTFGFSSFVAQGAALGTNDNTYVTLEGQFWMHDFTGVYMIVSLAMSRITLQLGTAGQGISGKGNTGKFLRCVQGGAFEYGFQSAAPPWNAASSTDPTISVSPSISSLGTTYTLANLPTQVGTIITSDTPFPQSGQSVATGAVTVSLTNAPTGSPATPARYFKIPDGAGGFYTLASLT